MVLLQVAISDKLTVGPKYTLAVLELGLIIATILTHPSGLLRSIRLRRIFSSVLIMIVTIANIASLGLVVAYLIEGKTIGGHTLLLSALAIYLTNILVFGLWYWEMSSPGLGGFSATNRDPDFLFPQDSLSHVNTNFSKWTPKYYDFLYISITNATAFSPTDAMPLTHRAKLLMSIQSLTSLVAVALVAARAVNILN